MNARSGQGGLRDALWDMLRTPVRPHQRGWYALGWPLVVLFGVQIATGILLSFYYQPSPTGAIESMQHLMRDVDWGWLVRGLHAWAAHGMVALVLLQLVRALLLRAWRFEQTSIWNLGLVLGALTLVLAFSGGLLPWDANAYWTATAALELLQSVPGIGPWLAQGGRGGEIVSATTLSRLHTAHVLVLPWFVFVIGAMHVWLIRRRREFLGGRS